MQKEKIDKNTIIFKCGKKYEKNIKPQEKKKEKKMEVNNVTEK